jgi:hypothetical protein
VPVALEDFFSGALVKQAKDLNKRIEQLLADRATLNAAEAKFLSRDVAEVPGGLGSDIFAAEGDRMECITLLGRNFILRRELAEFDEKRHNERCAAYDKAIQAWEQASSEIRQRLLDFGYHPECLCPADPCSLQPGMIARHPTVRAAWDAKETFMGQCCDRGFARANKEIMTSLEAEIQAIRFRGLQPASAA